MRQLLELGDGQVREVVAPERVEVNGIDRGHQRSVGEAGQQVWLSVPLPEHRGDGVIVAFRNARVTFQGPWRLKLPLPGGR